MKPPPLLLLPLKPNSELNGNEERASHPNRPSTRLLLYQPAGKLGKEMEKGAKSGYRLIRPRLEVDSNLLSAVSNPRLVKRSLSTAMGTVMDMLAHHYQDKLAELVNEDHLLPDLLFLLPHPIRQSPPNRLCDSVTAL